MGLVILGVAARCLSRPGLPARPPERPATCHPSLPPGWAPLPDTAHHDLARGERLARVRFRRAITLLVMTLDLFLRLAQLRIAPRARIAVSPRPMATMISASQVESDSLPRISSPDDEAAFHVSLGWSRRSATDARYFIIQSDLCQCVWSRVAWSFRSTASSGRRIWRRVEIRRSVSSVIGVGHPCWDHRARRRAISLTASLRSSILERW